MPAGCASTENWMWWCNDEVEDMEKAVVVREKCASRMTEEGLGLGRVRKNKMILKSVER